MAIFSRLLSVALLALLSAKGVGAQGTSDVICTPDFNWASNSKKQTPCLVAAWLQAECNSGTFSVNSIPDGYHYIGPTNDTSTQNPCICSTIVYELIAACGACQNRTWISWTAWKAYCPQTMTAPQGTYPGTIPADTIVPHWAYEPPSDTSDRFNVSAAKLAGEFPESSQVSSTTSSSTASTSSFGYPASSTTGTGVTTVTYITSSSAPPTSTMGGGGGGGKSSTNVGAIAGGVAGGVIGLALISFLGFLLLRNKKPKNNTDAAGAGAGTYDPAAAGAAVGAPGAPKPSPEMAQYSVASPTSPVSGSTQLPYATSNLTGPTQGAPYQATITSGGYYNSSDPAQATPPQGYPAPQAPYYNEPYNAGGRYSGMPEV